MPLSFIKMPFSGRFSTAAKGQVPKKKRIWFDSEMKMRTAAHKGGSCMKRKDQFCAINMTRKAKIYHCFLKFCMSTYAIYCTSETKCLALWWYFFPVFILSSLLAVKMKTLFWDRGEVWKLTCQSWLWVSPGCKIAVTQTYVIGKTSNDTNYIHDVFHRVWKFISN